MPRYFFDVNENDSLFWDDHGTEQPDLEAAELEARRSLGEMARDVLRRPRAPNSLSIGIRDDAGQQLLQVSLTYAVSSSFKA